MASDKTLSTRELAGVESGKHARTGSTARPRTPRQRQTTAATVTIPRSSATMPPRMPTPPEASRCLARRPTAATTRGAVRARRQRGVPAWLGGDQTGLLDEPRQTVAEQADELVARS